MPASTVHVHQGSRWAGPCGWLNDGRSGHPVACTAPALVRGLAAAPTYVCLHHAWSILGPGYLRAYLTHNPRLEPRPDPLPEDAEPQEGSDA